MKQVFVFFLLNIIGAISISAQQELITYGLESSPYNYNLNPAFGQEKKLDIAIANFYLSTDVKGPSLNDFGKVNAAGKFVLNPSDINSYLDDENVFGINGYLQTINVGLKFKNVSFNLGHAFRQQSHFVYSKDLATLLTQGNGDFIGETMDLSIKTNMTSFHQINLGVAFELGKLKIGTNMKMLMGVYNIATENNMLDLHTSNDVYQLSLDSDYVVNSTGLFYITPGNDIETTFDDLTKFKFYGANLGFAVDLGAVYELNDEWKFSASVLDIGKISWTDNVNNYKIKEKIEFNGLQVEDLINSDGGFSISDTLENLINITSTKNEYETKLASSIYAAVDYNVNEKWQLTGLYYRHQHAHFASNSIAIRSYHQLHKRIGFHQY